MVGILQSQVSYVRLHPEREIQDGRNTSTQALASTLTGFNLFSAAYYIPGEDSSMSGPRPDHYPLFDAIQRSSFLIKASPLVDLGF